MRLDWKHQKLQHIRLANRVFASRMPVILPEQHHAAWLGEIENGNLKDLLVPYPADQMRMWEISPRVNSR
jgi:putative SOS response-associated peptidase YedK